MGVQQSTLRKTRNHLHSSSTPDLQSSSQTPIPNTSINNVSNVNDSKSTTLLRTSRSSSYPNMSAIMENPTEVNLAQANPHTSSLQHHEPQHPTSSQSKHDPQRIAPIRSTSTMSWMSSSSNTYHATILSEKIESTTDESMSTTSTVVSPALSAVSSSSSSSSFTKWSCTNCSHSFIPSSSNDGNDEFCSGDCYWSYMFTIHDHNYGCTCSGSVFDNNCICYQRYLESCHDNSIYYDDEYVRYRHERAKIHDSLSSSSNPFASSGLSIAGDSNAKAVPMPTISVVHHPTLAVPAYASGPFLQYAYNPYYYPQATRVNA